MDQPYRIYSGLWLIRDSPVSDWRYRPGPVGIDTSTDKL
jgi:hypothetical protein